MAILSANHRYVGIQMLSPIVCCNVVPVGLIMVFWFTKNCPKLDANQIENLAEVTERDNVAVANIIPTDAIY